LSSLQKTLQRAQSVGAFVRRPIIVCNEAHRFLVAEARDKARDVKKTVEALKKRQPR
jgi:mannose-1-phosphate guanylyltransferase